MITIPPITITIPDMSYGLAFAVFFGGAWAFVIVIAHRAYKLKEIERLARISEALTRYTEAKNKPVKWYPRDIKPVGCHRDRCYFPVLLESGNIDYRLFEEGAWWRFSYIEPDDYGEDGGWKLVPNASFKLWADLEPPRSVPNDHQS